MSICKISKQRIYIYSAKIRKFMQIETNSSSLGFLQKRKIEIIYLCKISNAIIKTTSCIISVDSEIRLIGQ